MHACRHTPKYLHHSSIWTPIIFTLICPSACLPIFYSHQHPHIKFSSSSPSSSLHSLICHVTLDSPLSSKAEMCHAKHLKKTQSWATHTHTRTHSRPCLNSLPQPCSTMGYCAGRKYYISTTVWIQSLCSDYWVCNHQFHLLGGRKRRRGRWGETGESKCDGYRWSHREMRSKRT